ncbi:MAG: hypothetical protein Q8S73_41950 [Deltaproteobacteria bacterium]|nr:hypothetical protein [Myxococcales bacterium]MDP3220725.1 hypothetical protein [Deltaproteobacteria bacterium]
MRPTRIVSAGAGVYRQASLRAPVTTRARQWLVALLVPLAALSALASLDRRAPDVRPASRAVRARVRPAAPVEVPTTPLTEVVSLAGDGGAWVAVTRDGDRYAWSHDADQSGGATSRRRVRRMEAGAPAAGVALGVDTRCGHGGNGDHDFVLLTRAGQLQALHQSAYDPVDVIDAWRLGGRDERVVDVDTAGDLWIERTASGFVHVGSACEPSEHHYANLAQAPSAPARFADAASVTAGGQFACVNTAVGAVHCWAFHNVLDGGSDPRDYVHHRVGPSRVPVPPVSRVALDGDRGCGVARDGGVWCWSAAGLPALHWNVWRHPWLRDASTIHPLGSRLCATLHDQRVLCDDRWRTPPSLASLPPRSELAGLRGAVQIIEPYSGQGCARLADGTVRCWDPHDLPDGRLRASTSPVRADVDEPLTSLASGQVHTCGLGRSGRVWCWGAHHGESYSAVPAAPVEGVADAVQVAVGARHVCARLRDGAVACWGYNPMGECAQPRIPSAQSPVVPLRVAGLDGVVQVSAGDGHACARLAGGSVRCWGAFGTAWPGHPRVHGAVRPLAVALPFAAVGLVSSGAYACARSADGRQVCWGGDRGAGDDGETHARETIDVAAEVVASPTASLDCVRDERGRVRCGARFDDRPGGLTLARDDGEVVGDGAAVVGSGAWHTCTAQGDAVTCARRTATPAQESDPATPADVRLPRAPRALTAGRGFSCALTADGAAWCWGDNRLGQLGTGVPGVVTIDAPTVVVR